MEKEIRTYFLDATTSTGSIGDFSVEINTNDDFFNLKEDEKMFVYPTQVTQLNDFPNINSTNNKIGFYVTTTSSSTALDGLVFTFSDLKYINAYSLQDYINTYLEDALDLFLLDGTWRFSVTCSFLADENRFSIKITSTNSFFDSYRLYLTFEDKTTDEQPVSGVTDNSAYKLLGFNSGDIYEWDDDTETVKSVNSVNLLLHEEIYIHTNFVQSNYENTSTNIRRCDLFFVLANSTEKNALLVFENANKLYYSEMISNIDRFSFRLLDKDNTVIDFKTYPRITLTFEKFSYKSNLELQIHNILERMLKVTELSALYNSLK